MLTGGMHHLTRLALAGGCGFTALRFRRVAERQIDQVAIAVRPDVLDGLQRAFKP